MNVVLVRGNNVHLRLVVRHSTPNELKNLFFSLFLPKLPKYGNLRGLFLNKTDRPSPVALTKIKFRKKIQVELYI